MVCTRLDLAYSVSVVSRLMSNPWKAHWETGKWNMRYLKEMTDVCLVYRANTNSDLDRYEDSYLEVIF